LQQHPCFSQINEPIREIKFRDRPLERNCRWPSRLHDENVGLSPIINVVNVIVKPADTSAVAITTVKLANVIVSD
jgi:hypothetical protein